MKRTHKPNTGFRCKIDRPDLLEQELIQEPTEKKRERWLEENQQALEAYNQRVEERGVFNDSTRAF